jgi:hypothetical protein
MNKMKLQANSLKLLESSGIRNEEELFNHQVSLSRFAASKSSKPSDAGEFFRVLNAGLMIDRAGRGFVNLTAFVDKPFSTGAKFNVSRLDEFVKTSFRFLDNLHLGLKTKPMFTIDGLSDSLLMMGHRYDTIPARRQAESMIRSLRNCVLDNSIRMGVERGEDKSVSRFGYLNMPACQAIPADLRRDILNHGLRQGKHLWLHSKPISALAYFNGTSPEAIPPLKDEYRWRIESEGYLNRNVKVSNYACMTYRDVCGGTGSVPDGFIDVSEVSLKDIQKMRFSVSKFMDGPVDEIDQRVKRFAGTATMPVPTKPSFGLNPFSYRHRFCN